MSRVVALLVALLTMHCGTPQPKEPHISGVCVRSFRATLTAWEASQGRVDEKCAYLDARYSLQVVDAKAMAQLHCSGSIGTNEQRTGCTLLAARSIYLLGGRDNLALLDSSVHEWVHALAACSLGDPDNDHMRAGFWALYGANTIEAQAQAAAEPGDCL